MSTGEMVGGRYRVERLLGQGGMGEVWLAADTSLHNRPVAIKRVLQQLSGEQALQRFEREVKALAGLSHPHIVTVHDAGHDARGLYYVMEYISGASLREWLQQQGETMPPMQQLLDLFKQILRGVAFAHGKGIIHRDLKPENVIVTDDGIAKVLDFGLAKLALESSVTQPQQRLGTPLYMAPEQWRGAPCDARTDVYSLGAMLFELCTLQTPFEGDNILALNYQHQNTDPPNPRSYRAELPESINVAILKALEKNQKNRYPSAKDFLNVIEGTSQPAGLAAAPSTPAPVTRTTPHGEGASALNDRLQRLRAEGQRKRAEPEEVERRRKDEEFELLRGTLAEQLDREAFDEAWKMVCELRKLKPDDAEIQEAAKLIAEQLSGSSMLMLPGGVTMEFMPIPPGTFLMGSPRNEPGRQANEGPEHQVTIAYTFWLGKYPVTQAQWQAVIGSNPSRFKGDLEHPVDQVSWNDCQRFIQKVNAMDQGVCRLPSEAEWEYTCRAGAQTRYHFGESEAQLGEHGWYSGNSGHMTHPVGEKKPNAWGLYDVHGNVWEWCQDWYHDMYAGAPTNGSEWKSPRGQYRVLRGGSWNGGPGLCRAAYRDYLTPDGRGTSVGFRLQRTQS